MKAVILAGGEGTRLRPLTCNTPKPMVPILNRPFLEHMLSLLRDHSVEEAILAIGYLPDKIQDVLGSGERLNIPLSYVIEEEPLGTAGAVKNLETALANDSFFVLNGDIFTDIDLNAMERFHRNKGSMVTLFLTPVEDPSAFGVVETDEAGRVLRFLEKPAPGETTSNWINGGIYLIEPEALAYAPSGQHYMFERGLFPKLLQEGASVYGYKATPYWIDLGTPHNYRQIHRDLLLKDRLKTQRIELNQNATVSFVDQSSSIIGDVLIGEGCSIGPRVVIEGPVCLGPMCTVEEGAYIHNSIVWKETTIETGAKLTGCILGEGVRIGQHASINEGCIVGDNVKVDAHQVLNPNTLVWPDTTTQ